MSSTLSINMITPEWATIAMNSLDVDKELKPSQISRTMKTTNAELQV